MDIIRYASTKVKGAFTDRCTTNTWLIDDLKIFRSQYFIVLFFILIIEGCTSEREPVMPEHIQQLNNLTVHPVDAEQTFSIQLKQDQNFGETEDVFIGSSIGDMAVDNFGRIYIADRSQGIHVYEADGTYLQRVGQNGVGPGEFQSPRSIRFTDDTLIVMDLSQYKISLFDLESYNHIKDINLNIDNESENVPAWVEWTQKEGLTYQAIDYFVKPDGNVLIIFGHSGVGNLEIRNLRTWEVSLLDPIEGGYLEHEILSVEDVLDVLALEDGGAVSSMLFLPQTQLEIAANHFIYSNSKDMLIQFYDMEGNYSHAFYYPYLNAGLTLSDAIAYIQNLMEGHEEMIDYVMGSIRNSQLPKTWPAFNSLIIDDENRLWISTIIDDDQVYEWWVLDENGELLSKLNLPRDRSIRAVKNGYLYTHETDELDIASIVRYRIEMEKI